MEVSSSRPKSTLDKEPDGDLIKVRKRYEPTMWVLRGFANASLYWASTEGWGSGKGTFFARSCVI